ncbi:MAG: ParB/RepB/Spo0J family partition protein [Cryomorphaceae bacterium]|nr:ParB/RepB/Spo0J family partition protein [Cryomorphaceae bacterium]
MAAKKSGLGKGLSALLKDPATQSANDPGAKEVISRTMLIDVNDIEPNPFQPRIHFAREQLEELANSITQLGIIQPITVRKSEDGHFQLISGERRWRAAKMAGLEEVPAYVRLADDQGMLEMALVENIQRQDLDAIEVAISYKRLIDECDITQEEMSDRVGKKRSTVTNYLRLLKLPPIIQAGIRDQMIGMGHARALVNIESEDDQLNIYKDIVSNDLSVRQVEELVRQAKSSKTSSKKSSSKSPNLPEEHKQLRQQLENFLGSKVNITRSKNGRGKLTINFSSDDDLSRIVEILNK